MARSNTTIHVAGVNSNSVTKQVALKLNICTHQLLSANSNLADEHLHLFTLQTKLSVVKGQAINCVEFTASGVTTVWA